uniref:Chromosome 4 open reading frame 54 n=1 Tax=Leptobrachium leishanense TaxID=445787 RepID=A0A8C5PJ53_9ANUR
MQDAALSPEPRKKLLLLQEPQYVEIPVSAGRKREDSPRGVTVTLTGVTLGKKEDRAQEPDASGDHPSSTGAEGTSSRCAGSDPPSRVDTPRQSAANNDEAHYITTHEIQLCEADQEPDYPGFGLAPSTWSEPVDSAPCAFLEYASFDSQGGSPTDEDCSYYLSTTSERNPTDSLGSTELVSTYSDSEPPSSSSSSSTASGRSTPRDRAAGLPAGSQILLSIKTASKAINEASEARAGQHSAPDARHETDMSFCVSRATESKSAFKQHHCFPHAKAGDAHRLVAIPARLQARSGVHADISSGASSVVSELDDADKEVRSLTSRAFRSLAYPYFEAINFSSSESTTSLSDQNLGINSWSTYLDWKGSAFLSQKAEQSLQHKRTTATSKSGLQKRDKDAAAKEQVYLQANKSHQTKAFEMVVSELVPKGTDQDAASSSSSSKKVQAGSRIVTLTETLNFSSNLKTTTAAAAASALGSSRACKPNEQAPVSACTDGGVAEPMLRDSSAAQEGSKPASSASEAMEGTPKSKFASSLLTNVISKKMQLEQEFKMERGEITDTSQKNQNSSSKDSEASKDKGVQRQSSRFSEAGSDFTLLSSTEDLADFFDSKALNPKDFSPAVAAESHLTKHPAPPNTQNQDSTSEGISGTTDTMKGNLLRSQNSAFRSWKEKEIEKMEKKIEEKVAKARRIKIPLERDWRAELGELSDNTSTKMSRLFVPGPQNNPKEKPAEKQATKYSVSTYAHQSCYSRNEVDFKTEKLHVLKASASRMTPAITPKPQEIKLSLGLASVTKDSPFNIAKLLTPNLASSVTSLSKASEELRNQLPSRSEVLEKMPQFLVRDVRETKPKVQGPIHQVRDVRKLLKSSYNHDSGDNSDRGSVMSDQSSTDPKSKLSKGSSLSPIVITCQAVKSKDEEGTNEDQKTLSSAETILVHRASGRLPVATIAPNKTGPRMPVVKIVSKASKWKQEKPKEVEVKPEPKSPQSQAALEKLTAAVKTMEQLYVYDKREWKRRSDPQPLSGSHVLSLIANHEAAGERKAEEPRKAPVPPVYKAPLERRNSNPGAEKTKSPASENKTPPRSFQVSRFTEGKSQEQEKSRPKAGAVGAGTRSVFTVSAAPVKTKQQSLESAMNSRNTRPQPPNSLKISQEETKKSLPTPPQLPSPARKASADIENYLTIPVKVSGEDASGKPPLATAAREPPASSRDLATNPRESSGLCSLPPCSAKTQAPSPKSPIRAPSDWRNKGNKEPQLHRASSTGSEPLSPDSVPPAAIYHHTMPTLPMAMPSAPAPIFFSPPMPTATPADLYPQQTQRKMLVDLATGQYYLVDTPVQPVKRRLFDPETGQYVEVPVPPPPATPVPLHMPPLTLSPGAYGAAYMFYPGFLPTATTVLPTNTLQTQLSNQSTEHTYEMPVMEGAHNPEMNMPEGPYYLATGSAPGCATTGQPGNIRRGSFGCPDGKQMISIMSQPGPRIVAPPSFDGTTMRFVVEHR